jgi:hypothetical protein
MCLTSGKLFMGKMSRVRKSADKIQHPAVGEELHSKDKKEKKFKIRVNSFHRTKIEDSLYDI